jgi:hypothetical protein
MEIGGSLEIPGDRQLFQIQMQLLYRELYHRYLPSQHSLKVKIRGIENKFQHLESQSPLKCILKPLLRSSLPSKISPIPDGRL